MSRTAILITLGMFILGIFGGCADDETEDIVSPPESETDGGPPSATEVAIDPSPGVSTDGVVYKIPPNAKFTLTFNEGVIAVTVNDTPASGSGLNWQWSAQPVLPYGSVTLKITWTNRDGSGGFATSGPHEVADNGGGGTPAEITVGTVSDGAADVGPGPINAGGFRFDFDERITGTIKLTDEAGADLDWIATVAGQTATLTATAGQGLVNETTYKIKIDVHDGAGNSLQVTITFVTKPK